MHTVTTGTGVSQQALLAILMPDDALSTVVHTLRRHLQLHTLTHTPRTSLDELNLLKALPASSPADE